MFAISPSTVSNRSGWHRVDGTSVVAWFRPGVPVQFLGIVDAQAGWLGLGLRNHVDVSFWSWG